MTSEWDNTPWSGSAIRTLDPVRTVSGHEISASKAVYGGSYLTALQTDIPINSWVFGDAQTRMAAFLRAYKVGWFYKAGRKISDSIASLSWTISNGDMESEDPAETIIGRPDLDIPFDDLTPIEQLIRLLERPNPYQTGKALFGKTQIRRDFAGSAMWYLQNAYGEPCAEDELPREIYGISPSRMWPSRDGGELIGWVLDKNNPSGGVPFPASSIISFPMASSDDEDEIGVGVVESVWSELGLGDLFARHTSDLMTTGGRLAGMLSPKNRALTPDEFDDAVKAWRSVASDPNAGRRLLLFPEPMEYSAGSSTPAEIGIPQLSELNRDNILTAFPISPYRLGVPMPGGLNSGVTRQEDRRDYWEETIHPRAEALDEILTVKLVSRYERVMGQTFDFDFDEPNMDDAATLIDKVGALKGLVSVGFDPKEAVKAAGLDHVKWTGLPPSMDPMSPPMMTPDQPSAEQVSVVTDNRRGAHPSEMVSIAKSRREKVTASAVEDAKTTLTTFFDEQRSRLVERIRATLPKDKAARKATPDGWWDGGAEDNALRDALRGLYLKIGRDSLQIVADEIGRIVMPLHVKTILHDLLTYGGSRITGINEGTRDAVKAQLAEGVRRGYSINQLIEGVPAENFPGITGAVLDNGTPAFDSYRAELISRTETALSYNRAAISGYGQFGVREVQAIDGDGDEQCAERDGRLFSIDDAYGIEDHPNGTLDWVPVIG